MSAYFIPENEAGPDIATITDDGGPVLWCSASLTNLRVLTRLVNQHRSQRYQVCVQIQCIELRR